MPFRQFLQEVWSRFQPAESHEYLASIYACLLCRICNFRNGGVEEFRVVLSRDSEPEENHTSASVSKSHACLIFYGGMSIYLLHAEICAADEQGIDARHCGDGSVILINL